LAETVLVCLKLREGDLQKNQHSGPWKSRGKSNQGIFRYRRQVSKTEINIGVEREGWGCFRGNSEKGRLVVETGRT